jgi:hypothetical protein
LLYDAAASHLRQVGYLQVIVSLEGNARARSWYEWLGWTCTGEHKVVAETIGVEDVRYNPELLKDRAKRSAAHDCQGARCRVEAPPCGTYGRVDNSAEVPRLNLEGIRLKVGILSLLTLTVFTSITTFPAASEATTTRGVSLQRPTDIDGVPLTPIMAGQLAQCRKYANQLHRPVVCPGLFLTPIPVSAAPGGVCSEEIGEDQCGPAIFQINKQTLSNTKQMLINQSNFKVPPGYIGVPGLPSISGGPLGHFTFVEGPTVSFIEASGWKVRSVSVPYSCHESQLATPTRIHGAVPRFYDCANGPNTPDTPALYLGHDLLTWRERGLLVEVSFHGHTLVNQDLVVAVAKATIVVAPKR